MERTRITRERLFAQFRHEEIYNLGKVQRTYMEANGSFTILQFSQEKPDLSLVPDLDQELKAEEKTLDDVFACRSCGKLAQEPQKPTRACEWCAQQEWEPAVKN